MKRWTNYLGQLRIYSLVDLMLLLVAAGASPATSQFWGAVFLWAGFLAHLESVHHNKGREPVPSLTAWLLWLQALILWKESTTEGLFIAFSLLYAQKKRRAWGLLSPLTRGLQTIVVVGEIVGFGTVLPWSAGLLVAVRNFLGDWRDALEDAQEGIHAWPVMFQWKSQPFAHLLGIYSTTIVWWLYAGGLPIWLLLVILIIETATYWLTPRPSNKNASLWLHSKILRMRRG